nr:type I-B CRISPR-associated protein Cas5b [Thermovirga lienii]
MIALPTVFEISGRMAMFRKPYTTTSSISYPFPPPSALAGMIAAILGYTHGAEDKGWNALYWEKMKGTQVALRIMNPVSWHSETINFWNVKEPQKKHIQVKHQFLREPRYRVFVKGPLEEELDSFLSKGCFLYTPYLGVAYALCDVKYLGRFKEEDCIPPVKVNTVIPFGDGLKVDVLGSGGVFRELVPFSMDEERSLKKSITVLFQLSPSKGILIKEKGDVEIARCGDDVVAWFPAW